MWLMSLWAALSIGLGIILRAVVIWVGVQGKGAKLGMFGVYHTLMGKRDRARHCFQRALKYKPDHF